MYRFSVFGGVWKSSGGTYRKGERGGVESNKSKKILQLNFTQVTTSFDMGKLKLSQFLQKYSPPPPMLILVSQISQQTVYHCFNILQKLVAVAERPANLLHVSVKYKGIAKGGPRGPAPHLPPNKCYLAVLRTNNEQVSDF